MEEEVLLSLFCFPIVGDELQVYGGLKGMVQQALGQRGDQSLVKLFLKFFKVHLSPNISHGVRTGRFLQGTGGLFDSSAMDGGVKEDGVDLFGTVLWLLRSLQLHPTFQLIQGHLQHLLRGHSSRLKGQRAMGIVFSFWHGVSEPL